MFYCFLIPEQILILVPVYTCSFISMYVVRSNFPPASGAEAIYSLNSRGYIREQVELTPSEGMMAISGFMAAEDAVTVERVTFPFPKDKVAGAT